jgi:hypothetical protein
MRKLLLVAGLAAAVLVLLPASALATEDNDDSGTYSVPIVGNVGESGDGDTIVINGAATFSWHPKSFVGAGTFTMTDDGVTTSGTWASIVPPDKAMLRFQPFGCGVVAGNPIPPNLCGGVVDARIVLTSGSQQMEARLTIVCVIGDVPGQFFETRNATEGVAVNVIGVENYSHPAGGLNVFIRTATDED